MDRSSVRNAHPLIVIDAAAPEAEQEYHRARADGAEVVVHGEAPWAEDGDRAGDVTAGFLALYADRVVGEGLPAVLAAR